MEGIHSWQGIGPHSSSAVREIGDTIDSNTLQQLVNILDQYQVCHGNPEEQFVSLVENRNGCIKRQWICICLP